MHDSFMDTSNFETRKAHTQLKETAMEEATPLASMEKNSVFTIHTTGPKPMEKAMM